MSEENKKPTTEAAPAATAPDAAATPAPAKTEGVEAQAARTGASGNRFGRARSGGQGQGGFAGRGGQGGRGGDNRGGGRGRGGRGRDRRSDQPQDEFESKIVDLARVTRVMAGGKRMSFRACVIVGDKKGRIAMGVKKGADVQLAVQKATNYAKKHLITVPIVEGTIPHTVRVTQKGASVLLKPAKQGSGLIAGGPVRVALEMAGIENIVSKMKGSNNKINNLAAVIEALSQLSTKEAVKQRKSEQ